MKEGDLVRPVVFEEFWDLGVVLQMMIYDCRDSQGRSRRKMALVLCNEGDVEWVHVNKLEVINEK